MSEIPKLKDLDSLALKVTGEVEEVLARHIKENRTQLGFHIAISGLVASAKIAAAFLEVSSGGLVKRENAIQVVVETLKAIVDGKMTAQEVEDTLNKAAGVKMPLLINVSSDDPPAAPRPPPPDENPMSLTALARKKLH